MAREYGPQVGSGGGQGRRTTQGCKRADVAQCILLALLLTGTAATGTGTRRGAAGADTRVLVVYTTAGVVPQALLLLMLLCIERDRATIKRNEKDCGKRNVEDGSSTVQNVGSLARK